MDKLKKPKLEVEIADVEDGELLDIPEENFRRSSSSSFLSLNASGGDFGARKSSKNETGRASTPNISKNSENDSFFFGDSNPDSARTNCEYGTKCYRRNPHHFKEYRHPDLESLFFKMREKGDTFITPEALVEFADKDALYDQLKILREFRLQLTGITTGEKSPSPSVSSSTFSESFNNSYAASSSNSKTTIKTKTGNHSPNPGPSQSRNLSKAGYESGKYGSPRSKDFLEKLEASNPFNFFLTKLPNEDKSEDPLSVSFEDLFHPSLGIVKAVCHFNFMVECMWFVDKTLSAGLEDKDVTVICGVKSPELENSPNAFPWLKVHFLTSPFPFGHHHTKMTFIRYKDDSVRFVVYTANLISSDWENRTQGVWIGPKCPVLPGPIGIRSTEGDSETNFRADLLQYLDTYPAKYIGDWKATIQQSDCSKIRVAFVGSAPVTSMSSITGFNLGLKKMGKILKNVGPDVGSDWPLIIQCSSIGSLGPTDQWVRNELAANTLRSSQKNTFPIHLIYPSLSNVKGSFDGLDGGGCLPYSQMTHVKQTWLQNILYEWKSDSRKRTRAMPHIKTYCRVSPDRTKLAWFLLTSANLSKAAWGKLNKAQDRLSIMSWEAGVLFVPKYIGSSQDETFQISKRPNSPSRSALEFPLPYDFPLTKYTSTDTPWFIEVLVERNQDKN